MITPNLHSIWEEKNRPGHTVEIIARARNRCTGEPQVVIKHIGVYNKRVQRSNTIINTKNFLGRYQALGD